MAKSKQVGKTPTNRVRKPAGVPIGPAWGRNIPPAAPTAPAITAKSMMRDAAHDAEFRNMRDGGSAKVPAPEPEGTTAKLMAALRASAADPEAKAAIAAPLPKPAKVARKVSRGVVAQPAGDRGFSYLDKKSPQSKVSAERLAELIDEAKKVIGQSPVTEAKVWRHVQDEAGLKPAALARLLAPPQTAPRGGEMGKWWDRIIFRNLLLQMSEEVQKLVDSGVGAEADVGELWRVPEAKRLDFLAKLKDGSLKGRAAVRRYIDQIG
jgi:hypothetical protein